MTASIMTRCGAGFDADSGARIFIVTATDEDNRSGIAETTIVNGAFTLTLPEALNFGWYVNIMLFIDSNGDETCQDTEDVMHWSTPIVESDMQYWISPDGQCDRDYTSCGGVPSQSPCWLSTVDGIAVPSTCAP